ELSETPWARGADEHRPAAAAGRVLQQRLDAAVAVFVPARHEAGAVPSAGHTTARAHVEERNLPACELVVASLGVLPVRVPAIDDDVSLGQQVLQLVTDLLGRGPVRNVDQDHARGLERVYELLQ